MLDDEHCLEAGQITIKRGNRINNLMKHLFNEQM